MRGPARCRPALPGRRDPDRGRTAPHRRGLRTRESRRDRCRLLLARLPQHGRRAIHTNTGYWTDKVRRNQERDANRGLPASRDGLAAASPVGTRGPRYRHRPRDCGRPAAATGVRQRVGKMTGRKTTLVRELASVCAARYRDARAAAMSPAERREARRELAELRAYVRECFGDRCAWCGLDQAHPHRDHFPPLVLDRMWTGYTMDLTIPSCAGDNRQYADWHAHLTARWSLPDEQLREQHRRGLQHLIAVQEPVPRQVYESAFGGLRDELDRVLESADDRLKDLAKTWWTAATKEAAQPHLPHDVAAVRSPRPRRKASSGTTV